MFFIFDDLLLHGHDPQEPRQRVYPCVVIPLHTQHYTMLQRNLLYTAITGGRKLVVLVGSKRAVALAVGRVESLGRVTTLRERLAAQGSPNT